MKYVFPFTMDLQELTCQVEPLEKVLIRAARRDLDKNSFESKDPISAVY